jgi:ABC-type molybdate transport system substrate-binding protein
MNPIVRSIAILVALVVTVGMRPVSAQDKTVVVFAAASMKNALDDVDAAFTRSTGTKVVEAQSYLTYLRSAAAKAGCEQYGFTFLIRPTS